MRFFACFGNMTVCRSREYPVFFTAGSAIRQASGKFGLTFILASALLTGAGMNPASAQGAAHGSSERNPLPVVRVDALPAQAVVTLQRIRQGGPFPYSKDGTVFGNRERMLPREPRGYYREYTVKTVDSSDRGARRIVCGGRESKLPDACFYTDDHYASFRRIAQ